MDIEYPVRVLSTSNRIIQRGMSLKGWVVSNAGRAWTGKSFPMRDEPEWRGRKKECNAAGE
jgi:hypothetical protein